MVPVGGARCVDVCRDDVHVNAVPVHALLREKVEAGGGHSFSRQSRRGHAVSVDDSGTDFVLLFDETVENRTYDSFGRRRVKSVRYGRGTALSTSYHDLPGASDRGVQSGISYEEAMDGQ